jgi:hypothetical protein
MHYRGLGDATVRLEGPDAPLGQQRLGSVFLFTAAPGSRVNVWVNTAFPKEPVRLGGWQGMGMDAIMAALGVAMGLCGLWAGFRDPPPHLRQRGYASGVGGGEW